MGSGSSGLYYATRGSSQPYQKFYSVVPEMLKRINRIQIFILAKMDILRIQLPLIY